MLVVTDQMNRTIRLAEPPRRIVSLVPSQTELLYYLGCEDQVIGITKFCIHPEKWFREKTRIGGTKNVNFEKIAALQPDLIIANKEENAQADIEQLQLLYPVYVSDIFNVDEACQMIEDVGRMVNQKDKAGELVKTVQSDFTQLPTFSGTVLYFIWQKPYMVAGPNTFIGFLLEKLGFVNLIDQPEARYEEVTIETIQRLKPDHLLLSSEPFPFTEKHIEEIRQFYDGNVQLVDGEMFSWYGSRMSMMKDYFETLQLQFRD